MMLLLGLYIMLAAISLTWQINQLGGIKGNTKSLLFEVKFNGNCEPAYLERLGSQAASQYLPMQLLLGIGIYIHGMMHDVLLNAIAARVRRSIWEDFMPAPLRPSRALWRVLSGIASSTEEASSHFHAAIAASSRCHPYKQAAWQA